MIDDATRLALHRDALAGMAGGRPKRLQRALDFYGEELDEPIEVPDRDFLDFLLAARPGDQLLELWRKQLTEWDFVDAPHWSDTGARTDQRRAEVLKLLGLDADTSKVINNLIPVAKEAAPVVIRETRRDWYSRQSLTGRSWYWPAYARLLAAKGWNEAAVAGLDEASDRVVELLADPTDEAAYQSKGLVVGYVQSGKTANFTGVIAKAVDAGYRLVIVLGGTLNLLRAQTQRRLDMELVGRENILRGAPDHESDYADDPAWIQGKFLTHGALPSTLGGVDIVRMTTRDNDYKSLLQGIVALEFEKQEPALPLYEARNLHRSSARLMVVKKNKTVLAKLVKDLNKIKTPLGEIPVLIIDDESDEASVNTSNLSKPDAERTAINEKISELLRMLPRAQYVGYTATPFANVFIDPSDAEDIFPKDFIISLPRPAGYMGVQDFHDLDSNPLPQQRTVANSNEKAHVRDIVLNDEEDDSCLRQAIDMFVLTAAMKLYREANGLGDRYFQHHTMLIHESVRTHDHRELLALATRLWYESGYTGAAGHARLRALFDTDIAPVSHARAEGEAVPASFDELMPFVGAAYMRIGGDDKPIIVVNGDKDIETGEADFDKRSIWKILIGGQKLARGFTVEGLTVSYYRRRATNASTLMQMGRWFGFRRGYRDLVRLYVGREETSGAKEIDLYQAFEAICRDEEAFRAQLEQYARPIDGEAQITPAQVPPLVSQHLPWLKPTSPNKMFNARLVEVRTPGQWEEPTAYPSKAAPLKRNNELWAPILDRLSDETTPFTHTVTRETGEAVTFRFPARTALVAHGDLMEVLRTVEWGAEQQFAPHRRYLEEIGGTLAQVEDWLVVAPQHAGGNKRLLLGSKARSFSWFGRDRRRGPLFGAISEPRHRPALLRIAGALPSCGDEATDALAARRRGVLALFPVVEGKHTSDISVDGTLDPGKLVLAFAFVAPITAHGKDNKVVRFTTIDSSREGDAIITNQDA
ncbi:endonuclease [Streptomyces sp. NRRL F-5122]|uniref:Z1 domain-containing protein n=1 Tax=Streptomyces sp. NRRL F-5122 TaxID=1609098 RepID=UPI000740ED61|nr:Z1 domain-containing protein [Streptomyces sp. NRRL F-5122]KUJ36157.1 endonuclease [Streptomyces sp. NRRL F-5122]